MLKTRTFRMTTLRDAWYWGGKGWWISYSASYSFTGEAMHARPIWLNGSWVYFPNQITVKQLIFKGTMRGLKVCTSTTAIEGTNQLQTRDVMECCLIIGYLYTRRLSEIHDVPNIPDLHLALCGTILVTIDVSACTITFAFEWVEPWLYFTSEQVPFYKWWSINCQGNDDSWKSFSVPRRQGSLEKNSLRPR